MKKTVFILFLNFITWSIYGNTSVHVEQIGHGSPVVIIAGLGGTEGWQSSIQTLSVKFTCYLISIKGLDGNKNAEEPDYLKIESDIIDTLQKMDISNPILIGHSFGGFIAMQLASDYPAVFKKLIVVDSYPFVLAIYNPAFTPEMGIQQSLMIKKQLTEIPDPAYQAFWSQNVQQFTLDTTFQKTILRKIADSEKRFVIEAQSFVLSNDLRTKICSIQCPVYVLCSTYLFNKAQLENNVISTRIEDQFKTIKNREIFINDQSSHFIMLDAKEWFLNTVQKIIN